VFFNPAAYHFQDSPSLTTPTLAQHRRSVPSAVPSPATTVDELALALQAAVLQMPAVFLADPVEDAVINTSLLPEDMNEQEKCPQLSLVRFAGFVRQIGGV
jgi:hypothetical protein